MSIDNLDMGYWIKVTVKKSLWPEQRVEDDKLEVAHIVEADHDHDHGGEGVAEDVDMINAVIPLDSKLNASPEGWFT